MTFLNNMNNETVLFHYSLKINFEERIKQIYASFKYGSRYHLVYCIISTGLLLRPAITEACFSLIRDTLNIEILFKHAQITMCL